MACFFAGANCQLGSSTSWHQQLRLSGLRQQGSPIGWSEPRARELKGARETKERNRTKLGGCMSDTSDNAACVRRATLCSRGMCQGSVAGCWQAHTVDKLELGPPSWSPAAEA